MDVVNQKIIDAVIAKANQLCPGSLALIGIYGSVATAEAHTKSDLDLLILIEDEAGRQLGTGFLLDDSGVGYDIYCTDWHSLRYDAECHHARIAKLMDAQIVYVRKPEAYNELRKLRAQTKRFLESEERFGRVDALIGQAKIAYANACLSDELGQVRLEAFGVVEHLLSAMMLYHGTYFKRGVKKTFEELTTLPLDGAFAEIMQKIVRSKAVPELRELLKALILFAEENTRRPQKKAEASEALAGTYEEMYSNWRNKVEMAAKEGDAFASFVNMCGLQWMLTEISKETEIGVFDVMGGYNPDSLADNADAFDKHLRKYEGVYKRAGISVKRFADVDAFVDAYLCR